MTALFSKRLRNLSWLMAAVVLFLATSAEAIAGPAPSLTATAPSNDDGLSLTLTWQAADLADPIGSWSVLRADQAEGPFSVVVAALAPETDSYNETGLNSYNDRVTTDPLADSPKDRYFYQVVALPPAFELPEEGRAEAIRAAGLVVLRAEGSPQASWFKSLPSSWMLLGLIFAVGGLMHWFTRQARAGKEITIRRIPGIDAIEEGIGRATEMGKPVLYVPGIDELQDIQTIASMLILGQVAETVAEYQSEIIVSCCIPIVREVADEVVRAGFYQAGHPDAYRPTNTRFISSEQFAFCAGTNGIIHREKPATNIYLGRFFAESLILAETGFVNKSIQIAGTAEASQLPFFIAACDYTLIGEELFAVSAYLSKDPRLVSSLKASDWMKAASVAAITAGTIAMSLGSDVIQQLFVITGG